MAAFGGGSLSREDKIFDLIDELAFAITDRHCDDDDQVKAFVENATTALSGIHAPMLSKKTQKILIDSLALKFKIHGFPHLGDNLQGGVNELYEMKDTFFNSDTPCNMIDLLTKLSWKPLEYAQQVAMGGIEPENLVVPAYMVKEVDWPAYIREGNCSFPGDSSDTDSDLWSQISEEEEIEVLYVNQAESKSSSLDVRPSQESMPMPKQSQAELQNSAARAPFRYSSDPFMPRTRFIVDPSPSELVLKANLHENATQNEGNQPPKELDPITRQIKQRFVISYQSKQKIDEEIQDGEWFSPEKMTKTPGMPSAELGVSSETCQLTEWQILREALWMLQAPTNCRCFGLDSTGKFQPRPDFTVIDVNTHILWSFLERYCRYFDMVNEAEKFGSGLDTLTKQPPATYRVYFRALEENITAFKESAARVMNRLVRQEDSETLISVTTELEPSFERLEFVMALHRKATCDWTNSPNWLSAIRLLSVLYWTVTESVCLEHCAIAADLYLKSFQPYVTIIDNLLTLGKCTDVHNEFIIYRADDLDSSMRESWDEGFYVRPYARTLADAGIRAPSMLDKVIAEIVLGCKSVYVVARLDKLCYADGYQTNCTLYIELITRLEKEFSRNVNLSASLVDLTEEQPSIPKEPMTSSSNQSLCTEILTDPYFLLSFKGEVNVDNVESEQNKERNKFVHPCVRLRQYTSKEAFRYQWIFERVFQDLISNKYNVLGKLINAVMRNDVQIGKHLKALRAVFMIEAGDLMAVCYDCLVKKEKDEPYWLYSHYLTSNIEDYFVKSFPGYNNFEVSVDKRFVDENILEAIDGIELTYKVDWPLSFIVNKPNLELYNEIFRLLLKLKMTLTSLERLRFTDLKPPGESRKKHKGVELASRLSRWHLLRFQLIGVVGGVHCFVMNHIKHTFGPELDDHIESASDFDLIVQEHGNYLQTVHELCANPLCSPALAKSFSELLDLAHCCVDLWPFGRRQAIDLQLTHLEDTYQLIHRHINSELREFKPSDSRLHIDGLQALFY